MMLLLKGILRYSPQREGLKRLDQSETLILEFPKDEMAQYYQFLIKTQYGQWLKLQQPMFNLHVTVVRPQEVDLSHPSWLKYDGEEVTIQYNPEELERHWEFWSLTVYSTKLVDIRKELGLRADFRLHITVGRQYEWQPKVMIKNLIQDTDYLLLEPNSK